MKTLSLLLLVLMLATGSACAQAQEATASESAADTASAQTAAATAAAEVPGEEDMVAYLLVYFKDDTHSIHMALSSDGYSFTALNDDKPLVDGKTISLQQGIRDPYLTRGPDGRFYMAMTDLHIFAQREGLRETEWERPGAAYGWGNNRALVLMHSDDLITWEHANLRVDRAYPALADIGCAWAPELIYDEQAEKMMLYYTMRFGNGQNRLYYTYLNDAFTEMVAEPKLLFDYPRDVSYIDADITRVGPTFHMFYTPHDGVPGVKHAVSDRINAGYRYREEWIDPEPRHCEAPNVWKRIGEDKWVLMYDVYGVSPHNFGFSETTDFHTFTHLGHFNQGVMKSTNFSSPKHGSVIHLTEAEARRLAERWGLESY